MEQDLEELWDLPRGNNFIEIGRQLLDYWPLMFDLECRVEDALSVGPSDIMVLATLDCFEPTSEEEEAVLDLLFRRNDSDRMVSADQLAVVGESYAISCMNHKGRLMRLAAIWKEAIENSDYFHDNGATLRNFPFTQVNRGYWMLIVVNSSFRELKFIRLVVHLLNRAYAGERSDGTKLWDALLIHVYKRLQSLS